MAPTTPPAMAAPLPLSSSTGVVGCSVLRFLTSIRSSSESPSAYVLSSFDYYSFLFLSSSLFLISSQASAGSGSSFPRKLILRFPLQQEFHGTKSYTGSPRQFALAYLLITAPLPRHSVLTENTESPNSVTAQQSPMDALLQWLTSIPWANSD